VPVEAEGAERLNPVAGCHPRPFAQVVCGTPGRKQCARYGGPMALELYAGIRVSDYETAKSWYERLLGSEPSFLAHATEAVWELAEHRSLFIVEGAEGAGRAIHTIFVDDLDARVADIASRGIEPDELVTYPGKARRRSTATPTATRPASAALSIERGRPTRRPRHPVSRGANCDAGVMEDEPVNVIAELAGVLEARR
jgi:hypothetical protein